MVDALVSAILQQLALIIDREVQEEVKLVTGVDKEVHNLTSLLETIQAVVEDAERRQMKEVTIKNWLIKLKNVAYDMDDVLDEWSTAILKWKIDGKENQPLSKQKMVCSCLPFPGFCSNLNQVILRHDIALKIKEVCDRVDAISRETVFYTFKHTEEHKVDVVEPGRLSTSFIDVSRVCGRDEDKKAIVGKLLSETKQEVGYHVISIVGMGGIGKTTLAQLAYNDEDVNVHFNRKIWVSVSETFDQIRIAKAILESLSGYTPNLSELDSLLRNISKLIRRKKVLLVLDDVWTQDPKQWEPLRLSLKCAAPGSKILVTTRKEIVAKKMESSYLFHLGELSEDECWALFSQVAFYGRSRDEREALTEMGMKIARKCKGLPFAAKTLGDLMQLKRTREEWKTVLASELWELEEIERGLFPPLLLSYYDLPAPVRRCLLYCSIFPKDYKMEKAELINLWMAHGYLGENDMEFVGDSYFENLVLHSLFQDVEEIEEVIDSIKMRKSIRFKMHDVVHDFVYSLTRNECFMVDDYSLEKSRIGFLCEKARHLAMILSEGTPFPVSIYKARSLRSLSVKMKNAPLTAVLPDLFQQLTCLRSLDLSESSVEEIPSEVGKLLHLRHLNLSQNAALKALPETLSNLYNLLCLDLTSCKSLKRLPLGMGKLTRLRHLQIVGSSLIFVPKGLERLTSLQTLSYFIVCSGEEVREAANLRELKKLNQLRGNLLIRNLGSLVNLEEALDADLKNKKNLNGLYLDFTREEIGLQVNDDNLIEVLEAPSDLEYLRIGAYKGTSFPNWMVSLMNLRELEIVDSRCELLPSLGSLCSLIKLTMNIRSVRSLDAGFLGIAAWTINSNLGGTSSVTAFPKLKELTIWYMKELEEWEECIMRMGDSDSTRIMPQLERLRILDCPKLKALPDYVLTAPLEHLTFSECPSLKERYNKVTGPENHKVSHIQRFHIY